MKKLNKFIKRTPKTTKEHVFARHSKPFFFFAILKSLVGISFYCHFIIMPQSSSPHEPTTSANLGVSSYTCDRRLTSSAKALSGRDRKGVNCVVDALTTALSRGGGVTGKEIVWWWRDGEGKRTLERVKEKRIVQRWVMEKRGTFILKY